MSGEIERTGEDIINKYLEYKDNPEAMDAMTDILVFMGIYEAVDFHEAAIKVIEADQQQLKQYRKDYARYIGASFKNYMPFESYVQKREKGLL